MALDLPTHGRSRSLALHSCSSLLLVVAVACGPGEPTPVRIDAGFQADAGTTSTPDASDADTVDSTRPTLPPQEGGPCEYEGRSYTECFVGLDLEGGQRIVDQTDVLVLRSAIRNAEDGPCLLIRNSRRVDVIDVTVDGCDQVGIAVSNQSDSFDVRIIGGSVRDTGRTPNSNGSCITAGRTGDVSHPGLVIDGVSIDDCGFDDLDHGIYLQAQDYVVQNVVVGNVTGNGISVRSSGVVQNNTVSGEVGKARIRYFNDHPCGPSDTVRFLDNEVDYGEGPGISLLWSGGNDSFACGNYEIRGHGDANVEISPEFDDYSVVVE